MPRHSRKRGKEIKKRGISCTDSYKSIMRNHYKNGIYHNWFKWLQCSKGDKDIIKSKNIIVHSTTNFVDTRIANYKGREPIFR